MVTMGTVLRAQSVLVTRWRLAGGAVQPCCPTDHAMPSVAPAWVWSCEPRGAGTCLVLVRYYTVNSGVSY